jgi:hypothetical protein
VYVLEDATLFKGLVLKCSRTLGGATVVFPINVQPVQMTEGEDVVALHVSRYDTIGSTPSAPFFGEVAALHQQMTTGDARYKLKTENAADLAAVVQLLSDYFGVVLPMYSVYAVCSELAGSTNLWEALPLAGAKPAALSLIRDEINKVPPKDKDKEKKKIAETVRKARAESGFDTALAFFGAFRGMVVSEYWLRKSDGDDLAQASLQNSLKQVLDYQNVAASKDVAKAMAGFAV